MDKPEPELFPDQLRAVGAISGAEATGLDGLNSATWHLPRLTTRRWMIAVAVVAILIGAVLEVHRRSRRFARLAAYHSNLSLEHFHTQMALGVDPLPLEPVPPAGPGAARYLRREKALVRYHSELTAKYERAARYPWLPVTPDPPEPD
jgi:hypothetical protein